MLTSSQANQRNTNVTSSVQIRTAVADDKKRCLELLYMLNESNTGEGISKVFEQLLDQSRGTVWVAEEAGVLLGMASVSYNLAMRYEGEYCQLEELIVDPAARGKNVGGLLVQHSIDQARARGCAEYGLYLVKTTEQNRPFYEKYGLEVIGTEMRLALA